MIKITSTAESVEQAEKLMNAGVDDIYVGEEVFGLRVPQALSYDEIREITELAHSRGKTVTVAVNALMHTEKMAIIKPFLDFLQEIKVDKIAVGDAGVIYVLQRDKYNLPFTYDASTMVVSSRQTNFWAEHGAVEAVLARELPKAELEKMANELKIPGEILVYGATVIHHTKRPLVQNYYNFIQTEETGKDRARNLFISEPRKDETHYSIFEDSHGTHIYANDDINMMEALSDLTEMGYQNWKIDGIFTRGDDLVKAAELFIKARTLLEAGEFTSDKAFQLSEELRKIHPAGRTLSRGFYDLDPDEVK